MVVGGWWREAKRASAFDAIKSCFPGNCRGLRQFFVRINGDHKCMFVPEMCLVPY